MLNRRTRRTLGAVAGPAIVLFGLVAAGALRAVQLPQSAPAVSSHAEFARLVAELSEPGGYFDTDNLISNERSYLQVIPELEQRGISGGIYIGVGPDQNFSYIAQVRPTTAFILDIRRDNLLLHLLFKALFASARTRIDYLCLLTGRRVPLELPNTEAAWRAANVERLVAYIDAAGPRPPTSDEIEQLHRTIRSFGIPISADDLTKIDRFHRAFITEGLGLRFQSFGRPTQSYNPTLRQLLLEVDSEGKRRSYLASEASFQFVKSLEAQDRIIPVVGDFAGDYAFAAIARWVAERNERVSVFYASNVENYLFRDGKFDKFATNLRQLPHSERAVIIRSVFGRPLRETMPGYYSTNVVEGLDEMLANFAARKYRTYNDLIGR